MPQLSLMMKPVMGAKEDSNLRMSSQESRSLNASSDRSMNNNRSSMMVSALGIGEEIPSSPKFI